MRLPRPRLTVRRMMGLVALAALILGGVRARERYLRCMVVAGSYEAESRSIEKSLSTELRYYKDVSMVQARLVELIESRRGNWRRLRDRAESGTGGRTKAALYETWASEDMEAVEDLERRLAEERRDLRRQVSSIAMKKRLLAHLARLKGRYERAAYRPWERLPMDPPPADPDLATEFWRKRGDYARALDESREAIIVDPENPEAYNLRAWILATCPDTRFRDGSLAVKEATRACELSQWRSSPHLDTLAAACAASGDCASAIEWEERAIRMTSDANPEKEAMTRRLGLYRAGQPYRDDP